jgi:hypothetical protein
MVKQFNELQKKHPELGPVIYDLNKQMRRINVLFLSERYRASNSSYQQLLSKYAESLRKYGGVLPPFEPAIIIIPDPSAGGAVLVLVDGLGKPGRNKQIKRLLTEKINRLILNNKTGYKIVSYEDVLRLKDSRKDYNRMGIANIAQELGANQIIYVRIDEFSLKDDPGVSLWRGKLDVSVRVVDSQGKTKWPIDRPAGHRPEAVETSQVDDPSPAYGAKVAAELADEMAAKIANLWKTINRTKPAKSLKREELDTELAEMAAEMANIHRGKSAKPVKREELDRHLNRPVLPSPTTRPASDIPMGKTNKVID